MGYIEVIVGFCIWIALSIICWCACTFRSSTAYSALGPRSSSAHHLLPVYHTGRRSRPLPPHTSRIIDGIEYIFLADGTRPTPYNTREFAQSADVTTYPPDFAGQNSNQVGINDLSPASRQSPPPAYTLLPPQESVPGRLGVEEPQDG